MIKYPDEYIDSFKNLIRNTNIFKLIYFQNILFLNYLYLETRRFLGRLKGNISQKILLLKYLEILDLKKSNFYVATYNKKQECS